jgi:hypothetical protein
VVLGTHVVATGTCTVVGKEAQPERSAKMSEIVWGAFIGAIVTAGLILAVWLALRLLLGIGKP